MKNAQEWLDEFFPKEHRDKIESLEIGRMDLEGHLDLRDFTSLKNLKASHNNITSADLSGCAKLEDCVLSANSYLDKVDTSHNQNLKNLVLQYTNVRELDLSKNPQLDVLSVAFSPIERIDVSQNPLIRTVRCLSCRWLREIIGLPGKQRLENFISSQSPIEEIDLSNCPKLFLSSSLNSKKLKKVNVNNCPRLNFIIVSNCPLTNLDLSTNTNLEVISIEDTPIKELDLSKTKVKERYLKRIEKKVKVIPPSSSPIVPKLIEAKEYLDQHFPKQYHDQVKELDLVQRNLTGHLDLRDFVNLKVLNIRDNDISSIDLSNCSKLHDLVLSRNPNLTEVDVSKNQRLEKLLCTHCDIKSLDLSKCSKLEVLDCSSSSLWKLDVSHNPNLKSLIVSFCHELKELIGTKDKVKLIEVGGFQETSFSTLDFSGCSRLYHFYLPNQRNLKKLNIKGCTNLGMVILEGCTQLADLDLSEQTNLRILDVGSTSIKKLNLANTKLKPQYHELVQKQLRENREGNLLSSKTKDKPSFPLYWALGGVIGLVGLILLALYLLKKRKNNL